MPDADDLVDREALGKFLESELGPAEAFEVERHDQGFSNETLFVTWGERDLVIRRPPPGAVAETAHDVLREYAPVDALQGTDVPVPRTVAACEDRAVLGCDFYVMERLDGDVMRFTELDRFAEDRHRERVGAEVIDTLAAIHTVDVEAVDLADFGDPVGFTDRQVDRWSDQLAWAFEETEAEREVPDLYRVGEWLEANVPEEHPHALVHGDYKLDNVLFAPGTPPELAGVLDWEMSTLGDPLCDLGWLLFFWPEAKDPSTAIMQTFAPTFLAHDAYPSRTDLLDRYESRTGFSVANHRFYRALAVYKMAALGEMFYARYLLGHSDSSFYQMMGDGVPMLAEHGVELIEGERPL